MTLRCIFLALLLLSTALRADPLAELAEFSAFPKVDLAELAKGKVITARSPATTNPRHLSVQACYVVRNAAPKTAELLRRWNGTPHPPLKVYLHGALPAKPKAENFAKLEAAPAGFLAATQKPDAAHFQLSAAEAGQFVPGVPPAELWGRLLARRASAFSAGGLPRMPAYEGRETVIPSQEATLLLEAQPKIRARFSALTAGALGGGGSLYWNMFDADGDAHVTLGAVSARNTGGGSQELDLRYYGSSGFFVHLTYFQLWPLELDGTPATLVWRGDLLSSASLAPLRGIERSAASGAMMRQVERTAGFFQKDATAER
jgi:hypothetical protein